MTLPPEVRALVVRQLGAALAARWRRDHDRVNGDSGHDDEHLLGGREGAADRAGTTHSS